MGVPDPPSPASFLAQSTFLALGSFRTAILNPRPACESAGLTFGLPSHPLEDVQAKKEHHKLLRSNHPYYRNVANISEKNLGLLHLKIKC